MRYMKNLATVIVAIGTIGAIQLGAQTPAADPSARLRAVLPADVAAHVLATIADARSKELPAKALENRALKFAARGVAPADIDKAISEQAQRMGEAKAALAKSRSKKPSDDEVEAGAEALRKGVDGAKVSEVAKSAPSGRSLTVPMYVLGMLVERGVPVDQAVKQMEERLAARASDADLQRLPGEAASGRPAVTGRDLAATKRSSHAGDHGMAGRPAGVPASGSTGKPAGVPPGRP